MEIAIISVVSLIVTALVGLTAVLIILAFKQDSKFTDLNKENERFKNEVI